MRQRAAIYEDAHQLLVGHYAHPYSWDGPIIVIQVDGLPIGQAAISSHTVIAADGTVRRQGHHSNGKVLKPWRERIGWAAKAAFGKSPWRGRFPVPQQIGVALDLTFTMAKPKSAPKYTQTLPTTTIDWDHLARAVGDALKVVRLYVDDAQIIDARVRKVFPSEHPRALAAPGAVIAVYLIHPLTPPGPAAASPGPGVTNPTGERV